MKTKILILLFFLFIIPLTTEAKFSKYVGVGLTRATLRNKGGKSEWGKFIGLGLEYTTPFSLFIAAEAAYATKKVTLENISWPSSTNDPYYSGMVKGNIPIDASFFELSTEIGYQISFVKNKLSFKTFLGPVFSLQKHYLSRVKETEYYEYDPEQGPYKFDYLICQWGGEILPEILIIVGGVVSYNAIGLEFRYARSITERKCMRGLTINDKLDSFYTVVRYSF